MKTLVIWKTDQWHVMKNRPDFFKCAWNLVVGLVIKEQINEILFCTDILSSSLVAMLLIPVSL